MKIDYSDELSDLKEIHEDNIGRKFSDEEFNSIFETALKTDPDLFKIADRFQSDMMGLLMTLDEATRKWEEEKLISETKGNPKEDIKEMMTDLKRVIEYYASKKTPSWSDVATLAHIHEALGEKLYDNYTKHTGYSRTIEEGMKRHTEASQNLWLQAESEIENIDPKKHLLDLARWKNFFSDLMEGYKGILHIMERKAIPELRQEAIDLAKKLGDDALVKYLETAPLKSIQRRIQALREEVEKSTNRPAKKAKAKGKKKPK